MGIHEKLNSGYYKSKLLYPNRKDFKVTEVFESKRFGRKEFSEVDEEAYKAARKAYREDQGRLEEEFKQDALEYCGISKNPKADKCYALAWEHSHSCGYSEVLAYLIEFAELIK